jgi:hypothetical protein
MGYSFVDDTDIIQSGQPGEPFQVLATCMQAAMDTWEDGLRAVNTQGTAGSNLTHLPLGR